jgi:Domain of unknown function (DUF5668)/B-box zinc finger
MNCAVHTEIPAAAYCRSCGKPLCEECKRTAGGTIFCAEHAPAAGVSPVSAGSPDTGASPVLAALLGTIPGVGAIYNGQYGKGLVHAVIFGLLVSILASGSMGGMEPLIGILLTAFIFYMCIEAYHTARKRQRGEPVEEFSGLLAGGRLEPHNTSGAFVLIALGVILLLNTLDLIRFRQVARYWPVLLILAGVYMLVNRLSEARRIGGEADERR